MSYCRPAACLAAPAGAPPDERTSRSAFPAAPVPAKRTPLHDAHVAADAKLVDFAGWRLPINYGSQVAEHHAVRTASGMFDVSHMTLVDVAGDGATRWLRKLLSGDVARLDDGEALYACLCNESGGTIDDLIAYRLAPDRYRLVVNAATRERDLAWLRSHPGDRLTMRVPEGGVMLAVQGPQAVGAAQAALDSLRPGTFDLASLARFSAATDEGSSADPDEAIFVGRTGYTGEDGVEIALGADAGVTLWNALLRAGVAPCGLGARDTLRLEAGMCLYGNDLDEAHTPLESGIGWSVDLKDEGRDFIGRETLVRQRERGASLRRVGLVLDGRGVLRRGQCVRLGERSIGEITSGTFSPTLQRSIAFARVSCDVPETGCEVMIRDKPVAARRAKVPFVRDGEPNG